ncbi:MAG: pyridoxamine 5'-phosphate oxidase family protein [Candidatus Binatia bacterium]
MAGAIPPEAEEFLCNHPRAFLLTLRRDGSPTAHPMTAIFRDGVLYFNTYRKSAKVRNIERDPRVSCLVTTSDDDPEPRGVVLDGTAEVLPGDALPSFAAEASPGAARLPKERGVSEGVLSRIEDRLRSGKRVLVRIRPERVRIFGRLGSAGS